MSIRRHSPARLSFTGLPLGHIFAFALAWVPLRRTCPADYANNAVGLSTSHLSLNHLSGKTGADYADHLPKRVQICAICVQWHCTTCTILYKALNRGVYYLRNQREYMPDAPKVCPNSRLYRRQHQGQFFYSYASGA